jgi:hypothetical protein
MSMAEPERRVFGRRGEAQRVAARPRSGGPAMAASTGLPSAAEISPEMVLAFVGPNSHKFEAVVRAMAGANRPYSGFAASMCWPAFFFPVIWLAYRKMWAGAAMLYFACAIAVYLASDRNWAIIALQVAFAVLAKSVYVRSAVGRIRHILASEPTADAVLVALRRGGGVSAGSAWVAAVLTILPVIAAIVMMLTTMRGDAG